MGALATPVMAQAAATEPQNQPSPDDGDLSPAPTKVEVQPVAQDDEIRRRIQSVMEATGWFVDPRVQVRDGVVFLSGRAETEEIRKWAGDLARNTQDVAAVANRIELSQPSAWDFSRARAGLASLWHDFIRFLPFLFLALFILVLSGGAGWLTARIAQRFFSGRIRARLLRGVLAGTLGVLVFLMGAYIVLRVSGLTQLALTIVGGTGLVGLAIGIAFRDITENFLASIFLSMQRPFETGDLVEVAGTTGYVQQMNVRTTVLMTLNGNLVQIPNAMVYKAILRNFTTNRNRRESFVVGIGYDDAIDKAQEVARKVLADHPAVLNDPEPWVLVDDLGKAAVHLRIYFWLNGEENSWLKVRSSVIRLVKRAFQREGITIPDEAREVVFPRGVPVTLHGEIPEETPRTEQRQQPPPELPAEGLDAVATRAEAGLSSEAGDLKQQARHAKPLDEGENLLRTDNGRP
ncbi:MAG: mechanosensitive ion channel domain-containing protein [Gemmatimonadaceae bacterium]